MIPYKSDNFSIIEKENVSVTTLNDTNRFVICEDHAAWDDFVNSSCDATIFHSAWWYKAWGYDPIVLVLYDDIGNINAGLCYAVGNRFGTRAMIRPPITPRSGPIFLSCNVKGRFADNSYRKKMMHIALHSLPKLGLYDFLLRPCDVDVMPFLWNGFDTSIGYSYVIPKEETGIWTDNISKSARQGLRRALKELDSGKISIEIDPLIEDMLPLVRDTEEIDGFSVEKREGQIATWWKVVRAQNAGIAFLIRDSDNRPMAADMLVFDAHTAYSVLGGIRRDLRKGSLVSLVLLNSMIAEAHQRGLNFDFEGSALPGVEMFMRKFNGELHAIYRVMKIVNPFTFAAWHAYRYWTGHRVRKWIWND